MENSISFSNYANKSQNLKNNTKKTKKIITNAILKEYQLKRNNFNPTTKSPNLFSRRLKQRMDLYYSSLIKL